MKKRVLQLFEIIKDAEAELKKIREKCPHKTTHVGLYGNDVAHAMQSRICSDCGECLGAILDPWPEQLFKSSDERFSR